MYNPAKAAQIIAYLALKSPYRSINVLKAIKLVYISDREALKRFALPMLDEPRASLPHGPVNSWTYDNAKGEVEDQRWSAILDDRANHMIGVKPTITVDDLDELSDAEITILEDVWARLGHMDQWELVDWTHNKDNIPEWEDPRGSSSEIPLTRVLHAVGVDNVSEQSEFIQLRSTISEIIAGNWSLAARS